MLGSRARDDGEDSDASANEESARMQYSHVFGVGDTDVDLLIHKLPLFSECSYDFVETVLLNAKKVLYRPGTYIVEEGAQGPRSIFFILWGNATLTCMDDTCKTLVAGDSFGEVQMLGISKRWHCSVSAETTCMVCELQDSIVQDSLQDYPDEMEYFEHVVQEHIRRGQERGTTGWRVLRRCAFLRRCSEAFLRELEAVMERRIFFRGQTMVEEGDADSALFVLDHGNVSVEIAGRMVRSEKIPRVCVRHSNGEDISRLLRMSDTKNNLAYRTPPHGGSHGSVVSIPEKNPRESLPDDGSDSPGSCDLQGEDDLPEAAFFGEEAILGISHNRSATIRVHAASDVRVLYKQVFLRVLARHPHDRHIIKPLLDGEHDELFPAFSVPDHPFFSDCGCSQEFFQFLSDHLEERIFAVGARITLDDYHKNLQSPVPESNISLCRLNRGRMQVHTKGTSARSSLKVPLGETKEGELNAGDIITGEQLWMRKTIKAVEVCYVSILHRGVVARALELMPEDRELYMPLMAQKQQTKLRTARSEKVAKILRERSIFANTSREFLNEIVKYGTIRVFMPGDQIIEQGTDGKSMFILWVGTANVVKESLEEGENDSVKVLNHIGSLTHGSVFGELVMLGVQSKRTASIIADTVCCTWEVENQRIVSILDRHPIERLNFLKLVEEHLDKLAAPRIIYHPLFSGFHQQFRTLVGVNCERRLCFPGETIVREGTIGDRLYIMNLGTAIVEMQHQHVMKVRGGSHFGFTMICNGSEKERYPVTVITETMCQVLIVTKSNYQHALHRYPEMREVAKALEVEERFRVRRQRECFSRMVKRRRGLRCIIEALRSSIVATNADNSVHVCRHILDSTFQGWHSQMQRTHEIRRIEEEQRICNAHRIEQWLTRRRDQMAQVKPRLALKNLVDQNLNTRGPLKLAKRPLATPPEPKRTFSHFWEEAESPYMSPSPVWRRVAPMSARNRRLPPLTVESAPASARSRMSAADAEQGGAAARADAAGDEGGGVLAVHSDGSCDEDQQQDWAAVPASLKEQLCDACASIAQPVIAKSSSAGPGYRRPSYDAKLLSAGSGRSC